MEPMKPMEPMKRMEPMEPMEPMKPMAPMHGQTAPVWWPSGLDQPSCSGGQNQWRYAFFPRQRRLAIERDGQVQVYDTGDHEISGVSQQQSGTGTSPQFVSQHGELDLESLKRV
jgi:hypothetical protein